MDQPIVQYKMLEQNSVEFEIYRIPPIGTSIILFVTDNGRCGIKG